jgi:hypothetical protein
VEAFAGGGPFTGVDDEAGNGVLARQDGAVFAGVEFFTEVDASAGTGNVVLYWPDGEVFSDGDPFTGVATGAGSTGTGDLCWIDGEGIPRREPLPGADAETGKAALKGVELISCWDPITGDDSLTGMDGKDASAAGGILLVVSTASCTKLTIRDCKKFTFLAFLED